MGVGVGEPIVAGGDAHDVAHAVVAPEAIGDALNDGVEPWAEATGSDERGLHFGRLPPDVLAGVAADGATVERVAAERGFGVVQDDLAGHFFVGIEKVHVRTRRYHGIQHRILALGLWARPLLVARLIVLPCGEMVPGEVAATGRRLRAGDRGQGGRRQALNRRRHRHRFVGRRLSRFKIQGCGAPEDLPLDALLLGHRLWC